MKKERDESHYLKLHYAKIKSFCKKKKGEKHSVPIIKLKGDWLRKLDFKEGEYVTIYAYQGILLIKPM